MAGGKAVLTLGALALPLPRALFVAFPFPFTFAFLLSDAAADAMLLPVAKWRLRRANKMAEASTEVAFLQHTK